MDWLIKFCFYYVSNKISKVKKINKQELFVTIKTICYILLNSFKLFGCHIKE